MQQHGTTGQERDGECRRGNRCGHNVRAPRLCGNLVRRGPDGHPPVIGQILARLEQAYDDPTLLPSWQQPRNRSRRRRSEAREAGLALLSYLCIKWFQLESGYCAGPVKGALVAPDIRYLARAISRDASAWATGPTRLSPARVQAAFTAFRQAGYLRSHQSRSRRADGAWEAAPALRQLTPRFFRELGGDRLWRRVQTAARKKQGRIERALQATGAPRPVAPERRRILSPRAARRLGLAARFTASDQTRRRLRDSRTYALCHHDHLVRLALRHYLDDPPPDERWSLERIQIVARQLTDRDFGLTA